MSGTKHDAPLDLVPLVEVAAEASQQRQILTSAAARTPPALYIQIPPGKVAYSSDTKRSVHGDTSWQTQQRVNEARSKGVTVVHNPTLRRDISFVALSPQDARRLATGGLVHAQQFIGGVKAASVQGDLEYMPAVLCLRPALTSVGSSPLILDSTEHAIRVELRDVLLDRCAMELLTDSAVVDASIVTTDGVANADIGQGSLPAYVPFEDIPEEDQPLPPPLSLKDLEWDDPFDLRSRAPGVFVLYAAAEYFFGSSAPDSINQSKVKAWFLDYRNDAVLWASRGFDNYKKLVTEENRRLAYKLIDTSYDLDKIGRKKRPGKPLDAKAVRNALAYRKGDYVSDRLSLVALAVKHWEELTEANPAPEGDAATKASHQHDLMGKLRREVRKWGIDSSSELVSIADFVTWPELAAEYEKAKKK